MCLKVYSTIDLRDILLNSKGLNYYFVTCHIENVSRLVAIDQKKLQ